MGVLGNNDIYFEVKIYRKEQTQRNERFFVWIGFAIFEEFSFYFYFFKSFYAFAFVSGIVILTEEMIIVGNFTGRKGSGKKRGCEKKKDWFLSQKLTPGLLLFIASSREKELSVCCEKGLQQYANRYMSVCLSESYFTRDIAPKECASTRQLQKSILQHTSTLFFHLLSYAQKIKSFVFYSLSIICGLFNAEKYFRL